MVRKLQHKNTYLEFKFVILIIYDINSQYNIHIDIVKFYVIPI
jgi:hypothetical protein